MHRQCLKRRILPDEAARVTLFLASDDASAAPITLLLLTADIFKSKQRTSTDRSEKANKSFRYR